MHTYEFEAILIKGVAKNTRFTSKISFPSDDLFDKWLRGVGARAAKNEADYLVIDGRRIN